MYNISWLCTGHYDVRISALAACICALGCFTTVALLWRGEAATGGAAARWLVAAAALFGCSVWSLHFVAMLAVVPEMAVAYDLRLTVLSASLATAGGLAAFALRGWSPGGPLRSLAGGAVLASGIAGMHYLGVDAMRVAGSTVLEPLHVSASVFVGTAFAVLAIRRSARLDGIGRRLEVALWLALAVCGLHFTGMAGLAVLPGPVPGGSVAVIASTGLAVAVAAVTLAILLASLFATLLEQHLSQRVVRELGRMRLLSDLAHEVLLVHRDGTLLEINSVGERLFGAPAGELIGRPVLSLFARDSVPALVRRMRCRPEERRPEEVEVVGKGGASIPVEISCSAIDYLGSAATAVALRDLSDRKRDEARIRHLARHDALTDLPNRYALEERLARMLEAAAASRAAVAVVYMDLDRFRPVNDLHGHAAGDALLVEAAARLAGELQPVDVLARLGADEFVAVLADAASPDAVSAVGTRLIAALGRPFTIEGRRVEVGASAGVAMFPGDGSDADALLRAADLAVSRAKEGARGTLRFYEASMDAQVQARRLFESELGLAVERGELALAYQPIVSGSSGEVETFEALVRWHHPGRGTVPPAEFIPLAEETDLIGDIGRWVIEAACAAAATWPQPWRVSVNVSPVQFRGGDVAETVAAALRRHGLPPARLMLEITEGVFIDDAPGAVQLLSELRALGVRLALDDFGTGYSSLSYLQLFRFDKFKIDKSFVQRLGQGDEALTILNAIVHLGHNLGLQVTAEGVETAQQLLTLQRLGCDQIQGYLVARPGPVGAFTEMDRARTRALVSGACERLSA